MCTCLYVRASIYYNIGVEIRGQTHVFLHGFGTCAQGISQACMASALTHGIISRGLFHWSVLLVNTISQKPHTWQVRSIGFADILDLFNFLTYFLPFQNFLGSVCLVTKGQLRAWGRREWEDQVSQGLVLWVLFTVVSLGDRTLGWVVGDRLAVCLGVSCEKWHWLPGLLWRAIGSTDADADAAVGCCFRVHFKLP